MKGSFRTNRSDHLSGRLRWQDSQVRINKNPPHAGLSFESIPHTSFQCLTSLRVSTGDTENPLTQILVNTSNQHLKHAKNRHRTVCLYRREGLIYEKVIMASVTFPNLVLDASTMHPGKIMCKMQFNCFQILLVFSTIQIFTFSGFLKMISEIRRVIKKCKICFHRWFVHC